MSVFHRFVRISICTAVGVIAVCLLYAFNVPRYQVDMKTVNRQLYFSGGVLNQTCTHKMSEIEWLQYMKYMNQLRRGKLRRKVLKPSKNALKNMRYTFSFVEGGTEGCLALFMKEYLYGKLTNGSSHFRVEIDSKSSIQLCSVDDYSDGTYHILCPVQERCSSVRVIQMYVNNSAYLDVYGSHALQRPIMRKLHCWDRSNEGVLTKLFAKRKVNQHMKRTPSCMIHSRGFVSWVQDRYHKLKIAIDKCQVTSMPKTHFKVCMQNVSRVVFIGGPAVQVYYQSILHQLHLLNTTAPDITRTNHRIEHYSYRYASSAISVASAIDTVLKDNTQRTFVIFGGWTITADMLSKNATAANVNAIMKAIRRHQQDKLIDFIWIPFTNLVKKTTGKNSHLCCYGNDIAIMPINWRMMNNFGKLGVDTFDVAYYASRIQSCNTIYKTRGPCKSEDVNAPYTYVHRAIIDAFLHYLCGLSHGLPVRFYSRSSSENGANQLN